ncbi:MAG: cation transporter [Chitinophagaceae bacterium]|nr:cation transporter [Oligoflexus sp.]
MDISRKATLISFVASVGILALKFVAYWQTSSTAILSDAMESIINVLAAGATLLIMKSVVAPADENHPYGHGKLEYFSAAFEGSLIAIAGLLIAREAVIALIHGTALANLDIGLVIATAAAVGNLALGFYIKRIGTRERSEALIASAQHILSDVWSTVGTLVGLGLVKLTGITAFDPIAAIVIAINLTYSGYRIFRRSTAALIDETDPSTVIELARTFNENRRPGVIDIHLTKVIRSGRFHHVDCHLVLPEFWTVGDSHPFVKSFELDVIDNYEGDGEINFHVDPCYRDFCSRCDVALCPVRQRPCLGLLPFTKESITAHAVKDEAVAPD